MLGISTADIIIISEHKNDTAPHILIGFLKNLDSGANIRSKITELGKIENELTTSLESFASQLQALSECIDLDIPFND
jgi:hypothetical protein